MKGLLSTGPAPSSFQDHQVPYHLPGAPNAALTERGEGGLAVNVCFLYKGFCDPSDRSLKLLSTHPDAPAGFPKYQEKRLIKEKIRLVTKRLLRLQNTYLEPVLHWTYFVHGKLSLPL